MWSSIRLLLVLQWKFWIVHIRRPSQIISDFLFPIAAALILCYIRYTLETTFHDEQIYEPFCTGKGHLMHPFLCPQEYMKNKTDNLPFRDDFDDDTSTTPTRLIYTPDNPQLSKVMNIFLVSGFKNVSAKKTPRDLELAYKAAPTEIMAGIQFDESYSTLTNLRDIKNLKASIRFSGEVGPSKSRNWITDKLYDPHAMPGPRDQDSATGSTPGYYQEGFLFMQQMLALGFLLARDGSADVHPDTTKTGNNTENIIKWTQSKKFPTMYMRRFPTAAWYDDTCMNFISEAGGLIMTLAFMPFIINTAKNMVVEKEKQLKEFMKIMGLSNKLYWMSWFILNFIYGCLITVLFLLLLFIPIISKQAVLINSSISVVFLLFILFVAASIMFVFIVCCICSKATKAIMLVSAVIMLPSFLTNPLLKQGMSAQLGASLIWEFACCFGIRIVSEYEMFDEGAQWNNMFRPVSSEQRNTLGYMILMLILDTIIYFLIAMYLDAIIPGEFGVSYPWNFVCRPSYWRPKTDTEPEDIRPVRRTKSELLEPEPKDLKVGVQIKNLRKVYGSTPAVQGLTLNMYENQITVLLGHNGAGKTTTISMLSGMITPTSGTAIINGYDIRRDMRYIRKNLGICPQHNIIFDGMTVGEHLYFYSLLKGMTVREAKIEVDKSLSAMDLTHKKNSNAVNLSGGMKRKLCICIALCGDSKVVMLDEPTSGMDPGARRTLWDMIVKQKKGIVERYTDYATILLTTHFMDEADVLGDRIAIMAGGELKCCGTSFFLKKKYGSGYVLIVDKGPRCDVPKITSLLKSFVPEVELTTNTESEVTYLLPENRVASFEAMLKQLESQSSSIGVRSYGISLTTMEEVFMKAGSSHGSDANTRQNVSLFSDNKKPTNGSGVRLIVNQIIAMTFKRFKSMQRSPVLWLINILLPMVVIFAYLAFMQQSKEIIFKSPPLRLTLSDYDDPITLVERVDDVGGYYDSYKSLVEEEKHKVEEANIVDEGLRVGKETPSIFFSRYIIGCSFNSTKSKQPTIGVWFNNNPYHSMPLSLSYALSAVFRKMADCSECSFEFTNEPFPFLEKTQAENIARAESGDQLHYLLVELFMFMAAFFILFIVKENACKCRHLQYVAGTNVFVFWIVTFIFDFLVYLLICLLVTIPIWCFHVKELETAEEIGRLWIIFVVFGWSVLPLVYLFGYLFNVPATGYMVVTMYLMIGQFVSLLLKMFTSVESFAAYILLFPSFSFMDALALSNSYSRIKRMCEEVLHNCAAGLDIENAQECFEAMGVVKECQDYDGSYWKWTRPGMGQNICYSCASGAVMFLLIFLIEYHFITMLMNLLLSIMWKRKSKADENEDDDVAEERIRIANMSIKDLKSNHELAVKGLTKYYGNFMAVNGLSLGVKKNECFGLLGVNGAGKTTTFKMITGDVRMTTGQGWVQGYSLRTQMRKVHRCIGYCPQFDSLLDDMTARETLIMFAMIKGYTYADAKSAAQSLADNLDFSEHLHKQVKKMSGGNKRKLSAAVALMGDPAVLYFDEPTTGMDPATKYYFREVVRKIRDKGKCIILTSHSLEECEAVCTRLAIMADGSFKCLGSVQHLKSKFAKGCTFTVKLKRDANAESINIIQKYVRDNLPSAQLSEKHEEFLTYRITGTEVPWSKIFNVLEGAKRNIKDVEDYSLAQGSLEQVFLFFSKPKEKKKGKKTQTEPT